MSFFLDGGVVEPVGAQIDWGAFGALSGQIDRDVVEPVETHFDVDFF